MVTVLAAACHVVLALLTWYSGSMFQRLCASVPDAVIFGDIGYKATGPVGRTLVYIIIYTLDASRCVRCAAHAITSKDQDV